MLDKELEPQIIVTTGCTLYDVPGTCGEGCYFKNVASKFGTNEISIGQFNKLIEIFKEAPIDLKKLVFIGGEPTQHSHLDELLDASPVPVRLFTNGLFNEKTQKVLLKYAAKLQPIFFHCQEDALPQIKMKLERNIASFVNSEAEIALRVNYSKPLFDFTDVVEICRSVNKQSSGRKRIDLIGFSFSCPEDNGSYRGVPIEQLPAYAPKYLEFVKEIGEKMGITIALGRPIPPCFLDEICDNEEERVEKLKYLQKYSTWTAKCKAINDFTINVDGSPQVCSVLHGTRIPRTIESVNDLINVLNLLTTKEIYIRKDNPYPSPKCNGCEFREKPYDNPLHCQGGCLTYRTNRSL